MKNINSKNTIHGYICAIIFFIAFNLNTTIVRGQDITTPTYQLIPYGNLNQWLTREIEESFVIGGKTRSLYEIAPTDTVKGAIPYKGSTRSPWRTSNVLAHVSGITKCSVTVFPEDRDEGQCARIETRMEKVKVLGIINISVLASGTIFLGEMLEPIRDTKNPQAKLNMGIPFTQRPVALVFDYKMKTNGEKDRIKASGFSKTKRVEGIDCAEVCVLLQKRWEDADGNVHAKRVGTAIERFATTTSGWINEHPLNIIYGDATTHPQYQPYMALIPKENAQYCLNSKGESVPILEEGWAEKNETPTHVIIKISSSHGEAYVGSIGNTFWIDNLKWEL